jgi:Ni/Co efflux regulator RcnB
MNAKRLACLTLAGTMGLGSLSSFAQDYGRNDRDRMDHQRHDQRAMGNRGDEDRGHDRRDVDRDHGRPDTYYYGARGPEWHRGGRVPAQYRERQYVVDDWRAHHLSAPPRGYHWVQVGNDYVLAAIATGIIASLILNSNAY